jgi:putative intracellular protease/amidase
MRVAIVTFDGFNELDSFIPLGLLNHLAVEGWKAEIAGPTRHLTSMNGVTIEAQQPLEFANDADVVLFGSGLYTRAIAEDKGRVGSLLDRLVLDPLRQTIGAQCSGALLLARLGLLADMPACTDLTTRPWLMQAGVRSRTRPSTPAARWPPRVAASRRSTCRPGSCCAAPALRPRKRRCTGLPRWARRRPTSSGCSVS